jgi:hypothetical protein
MLSYDGTYYGHYEVGHEKYLSKIKAILESERKQQPVKFVLYDDIYKKLNWELEPTQTLDQLYSARAWELRNRYDYLVLHFSGGADSTNILETFIRNNIKLDEIFIRGPIGVVDKSIANNRPENNYAEVFFQSYPLAEYVKNTYLPDLKITVVDTCDYTINYFKNNPDWFNFDSNPLNSFTPGIAWRADFDLVNTEFRRITDMGKTVAHLIGVDKPIVDYRNGQFYLKFLDKFINLVVPFRGTGSQNPLYVEPFYWAESTGLMLIKQGHVIKSYLKERGINPSILNNLTGRTKHDFIGNIVYNRTLPMFFSPAKADRSVVQPWDKFFFKDENSAHVRNWQNGMNQLDKLLPAKWKHNGTLFEDTIGIFTDSYCLGK